MVNVMLALSPLAFMIAYIAGRYERPTPDRWARVIGLALVIWVGITAVTWAILHIV